MDTDKLVSVYLKIRAAKSLLTKDYERAKKELDDQMTVLENHMLKFLNDTKQESSRTVSGTIYKSTETKASCQDWDGFFNWIRAGNSNDRFEAMEKRVGRNFMVTYMEEHDDELPPGISVFQERVARVRTGKDKE